jgi:prepilin signal peptidase PulO-like enzyme (type II secretory pathway)
MTGEVFRRLQQRYSDRLLTVLTLMFAILLFVVAPLQAVGDLGAHYFGVSFGFVLLAAVLIVSRSVVAVGAILLTIALIVCAGILRSRHRSDIDIYLDATAWMILGITLGVVVARAVFAPGRVTFNRVVGAVLLYLCIGLVFVALDCFVALREPNAFTGLPPLQDNLAVAANLIYFSFVTLTSVGYGDIVPLHPFARGLANVEAIIGQLYPATLLARLVSLELVHGRES